MKNENNKLILENIEDVYKMNLISLVCHEAAHWLMAESLNLEPRPDIQVHFKVSPKNYSEELPMASGVTYVDRIDRATPEERALFYLAGPANDVAFLESYGRDKEFILKYLRENPYFWMGSDNDLEFDIQGGDLALAIKESKMEMNFDQMVEVIYKIKETFLETGRWKTVVDNMFKFLFGDSERNFLGEIEENDIFNFSIPTLKEEEEEATA